MTRRIHRRTLLAVAPLILLWLSMLGLGGPESTIDAVVLSAANLPALRSAARLLTELGSWQLLLPVGIGATFWLVLRGEVRRGSLMMLGIVGGRLLVELQKYEFDRARPDPAGHLVAVHNMAFPSGHSANSMAGWLSLALIACPAAYRRPAVLIALLLAAMAGLSRLVLQVHWPSDVIGGWAFGAAWTLLLARLIGERPAPSFIDPSKEIIMTDTSQRPDDSALIDEMASGVAPGHSGTGGGNIQRDVASQGEEQHEVGGASGVTRVTGEDKPDGGDEPNLPQRS